MAPNARRLLLPLLLLATTALGAGEEEARAGEWVRYRLARGEDLTVRLLEATPEALRVRLEPAGSEAREETWPRDGSAGFPLLGEAASRPTWHEEAARLVLLEREWVCRRFSAGEWEVWVAAEAGVHGILRIARGGEVTQELVAFGRTPPAPPVPLCEVDPAVAADLTAYLARVREARLLARHEEALELWRRAGEREDPGAAVDAIGSGVVPRLEGIRAALRALPAETEAVQRLRAAQVAWIEGQLAAFRTFAEALQSDEQQAIEAAYRALLESTTDLAGVEAELERLLGRERRPAPVRQGG
jgi:hypothetical protein